MKPSDKLRYIEAELSEIVTQQCHIAAESTSINAVSDSETIYHNILLELGLIRGYLVGIQQGDDA